MSVTVRRVGPEDRAAWERLFRGYVTFYQASVSDDQVACTWQRLLAGEAGFHIGLVACAADGTVIGIAHVLFHASTWSPTCYCYLEDLFVDPDARVKGIGRALMDATYREADARGATRTYWTTQEFNTPARALYDQMAKKSVFVQYRR